MKKRLPAFLAGMLTTALVCGLTVSALAANGLISINASLNNIAIQVNGEPAIAKGENYTPDSGKETAGSILYNETTYVPLRKVGELLGADVEWDASTGTANIVGQIEAPVIPSTPPDNTTSANYSDWTPEEKAAYQEFKGMWTTQITKAADSSYYVAYAKSDKDFQDLGTQIQSMDRKALEKYALRFALERDLPIEDDEYVELAFLYDSSTTILLGVGGVNTLALIWVCGGLS